MKTSRAGIRRIFARPVLLTVLLGLASTFLAVGCGKREPEQLSEGLLRLMEAMGASDFDAARDELAKLDRDELPGPQQALVYRIESQLHSVAGEYAPALESLQHALDSGDLNSEEQIAAAFDKGWLHAQLGQPTQAVEAYKAWREGLKSTPSNSQLLTMSEAYAAAHDCAGAAGLIAQAYGNIQPEEVVEVAAALEVARPLCPDEPALLKYGNLAAGS